VALGALCAPEALVWLEARRVCELLVLLVRIAVHLAVVSFRTVDARGGPTVKQRFAVNVVAVQRGDE
jgi:hypothetical protein